MYWDGFNGSCENEALRFEFNGGESYDTEEDSMVITEHLNIDLRGEEVR